MPEQTNENMMPNNLSDFIDAKSKEKDTKILEEISETLKSIANGQKILSDLAKEDQVQKIKEKTSTPTEPDEEDDYDDEEDNARQMGFLRQTFEDTFSSIKDFLNPGSLMKSFGMISGSPVFMLLGDKLDSLIKKYQEFGESADDDRDEMISYEKEKSKNDFLDEQMRDEELAVANRTNELLEEIRDKEPEKEDKKGLLDMIKAPLAMFSRFLPIGLVKAFTSGGMIKAFSGLFSKGLGGIAGMGGKLLKGGGKLLGKIALPLAIATSGLDFLSGIKNAKDITGREGVAAAIQGGISEVISGLTFGLIDSKVISKNIDIFVDKIKEIFTKPFDYIKDLWSGKVDIIEDISSVIESFSFGLFSKESIKEGLDKIVNRFKKLFYAPMELIQSIWDGDKPVLDNILQFFDNISFGLLTPENVKNALTEIGDRIYKLLTAPVDLIKNLFSGKSILDSVTEFYSAMSFGLFTAEDIKNGIDFVIEKMKSFFIEPFNILKSIWDNNKEIILNEIDKIIQYGGEIVDSVKEIFTSVSDSISEMVQNILSAFTERVNDLKDKVSAITDMIKNPFETLKKMIFSIGDEEEPEGEAKAPLKTYKITNKPMESPINEVEKIKTIQRENIVLNRIKQEKERQERQELEKKSATESQKESQNNVLLNNNYTNHIYAPDDMTIKNDDQNWNNFSLAY